MHCIVGNCTAKRTNINKCYTADLIFNVLYSLGIWRICPAVPALSVHCFSSYIISMSVTGFITYILLISVGRSVNHRPKRGLTN